MLASAPLVVMGQEVEQTQISPAECLEWVHEDLAKIPASLQPYMRYVGLWNLQTIQERAEMTATLSGIVNGTSRRKYRQPLEIVPGSRVSVLRLNLKDYGWDPHVWGRLVDPHTTVGGHEYWPGGIWKGDGHEYKEGRYATHKSRDLAPWLSTAGAGAGAKAIDVSRWTGSTIPFVNGDWLGYQLLTCTDTNGDLRDPSYYDFLGIKNEKDFQDAGGVDVALAERFESVAREAVGISGVTRRGRAFVFLGKIEGYYYKTIDFKDNRGPRNPLTNLGKGIEKHGQASEQIVGLKNGLFAYGLFDLTDKNHKTVDRAPDTVAGSRTLPGNFLAVQNPIGCIDCHRKKGLQNIDGWVKTLVSPPLDVFTPDYEKRLQLRDEYLNDLSLLIEHGRTQYDTAIRDVTKRAGLEMTAEKYADAVRKVFVRYETPRTLETTAAYLGTTPARWKAALDQSIKQIRGSLVLSPLILGVANNRLVPYDMWEDEIEGAHLILRGVVKKSTQ